MTRVQAENKKHHRWMIVGMIAVMLSLVAVLLPATASAAPGDVVATGIVEGELVDADDSFDAGVVLNQTGATKVEWKIDGDRVGVDFTEPFEMPIDFAGLAPGAHSYIAKAHFGPGVGWVSSAEIAFDVEESGWIDYDSETVSYPKPQASVDHAIFDFQNSSAKPTWGRERIGFLIKCMPVGTAQVDPIMNPGHGGNHPSGHMHEFFGNAAAMTSSLTTQDLVDSPSNCSDLNDRSGYWAPTVFQDGVEVPATHMLVYYKSPVNVDQAIPLGLRMIAGDANAPSNQGGLIGGWAQHGRPAPYNTWNGSPSAMVYAGPDGYIEMVVNFPPCWDGEHLDSPDHMAHMAYPDPVNQANTDVASYKAGETNCPPSHPVRLPQLVTFTKYKTPGGPGLTLSTDQPSPDSWASYHQDFWNGMHPEQFDSLIDACIEAPSASGEIGLNCRNPPQSNLWTVTPVG